MVEILKTFLFLPVLNQLEGNRDKVRVHRRPGGGGGIPVPGLKGVPRQIGFQTHK